LAEDEAVTPSPTSEVKHVEASEIIGGEAEAAPIVLADYICVNFGEGGCNSRRQDRSIAASASFQVCSARQSFAVILGNLFLHEETAAGELLHC
jgi:hypothetical protein